MYTCELKFLRLFARSFDGYKYENFMENLIKFCVIFLEAVQDIHEYIFKVKVVIFRNYFLAQKVNLSNAFIFVYPH